MFDYEGSRSEFLRLLAEFGEEPAFIARARAPQIALEELLRGCEAKREELLKWPRFHLAALARQVRKDWSRLRSLLAKADSVAMLEELHANLQVEEPLEASWLTSDKAAVGRFLESGARFNRHWAEYLDHLDLEATNKPRREFNQFYVLEKSCAFASEQAAEGFEPLEMIDQEYLYRCFPLLTLPEMA